MQVQKQRNAIKNIQDVFKSMYDESDVAPICVNQDYPKDSQQTRRNLDVVKICIFKWEKGHQQPIEGAPAP